MAQSTQVKPLHALAIIVVAASLIFAYLWGNDQLLEVGGPNQMRLDRDGNLYIHISGQLFKIDKNDSSVTQTDLHQLGVFNLVGDFDFFANGDVLIRQGHYDPSLVEGIRMYKRITDSSAPVSQQAGEGLVRCSLISFECRRFGDVDFNSAFHLSIDPNEDTVYVSDTDRSVMRKYNSEGKQLAVKKVGFRFPNSNMLLENQLLVADTNHHVIKFLDSSNEHFAEVLHSYAVNDAEFGFKNWVFSFAQVGSSWWVNNMANTMSYGLVGIFDDNFKFQRLLKLPRSADPNDILQFNDTVYISDLANNRIYQFDSEGHALDRTMPPVIEDYMAGLNTKRILYKSVKFVAIGLFVVLLIAGFMMAYLQKQGERE